MIFYQGINDLQTEADRSAQRCIVASLCQQYPDLTIIGEEETNNHEVSLTFINNKLSYKLLLRFQVTGL